MAERERIALGRFNESDIDSLLGKAAALRNPGERIALISSRFLGIPYKRNSLIGGPLSQEVLVIDLEGMDCLTFLEYVEAMRRSLSFSEFRDNLRTVRYAAGKVDFTMRRHFFSDWIEAHDGRVGEATLSVGGAYARLAQKNLNRTSSGEPYVPGIPCRKRSFHYIPGDVIYRLETRDLLAGDYLGIYSDEEGLDVTHTGIVTVEGGRRFIRHASSAASCMKVVDEDLIRYIRGKPGIFIVRALS